MREAGFQAMCKDPALLAKCSDEELGQCVMVPSNRARDFDQMLVHRSSRVRQCLGQVLFFQERILAEHFVAVAVGG